MERACMLVLFIIKLENDKTSFLLLVDYNIDAPDTKQSEHFRLLAEKRFVYVESL